MSDPALGLQIEDLLDTISNSTGVLGVVICDRNGIPVRDAFPDLDRTSATLYAQAAADLVREADPLCKDEGGVTSIRVRTTTSELFIKANEKYLLVVVQDPAFTV